MVAEPKTSMHVRPLSPADLPQVVRIIEAQPQRARHPDWHTYCQRIFERFCGPCAGPTALAIGIDAPNGLAGYLLGEVRAVEFESEPCGWVFAIGVDPAAQRHGIAAELLQTAVTRFQALGCDRVRTMVARNDVPVLAFFRHSGFVGGPYVELELNCDGRDGQEPPR